MTSSFCLASKGREPPLQAHKQLSGCGTGCPGIIHTFTHSVHRSVLRNLARHRHACTVGCASKNCWVLQRLQQMLPSCLSKGLNVKGSKGYDGLRLERLQACKRLKFVAALTFDHKHCINGKQLPLYNTVTSLLCWCASVPSRPLHCGTYNTKPILAHNPGMLIAYTTAAQSHYCKGAYCHMGTASRSMGRPPQS